MALNKIRPSPWPSRTAGLILSLLIVQLGWMTGSLGSRLLAPTGSVAPLYRGDDGDGGNGRKKDNQAAPAIPIAALNLFGNSASTVEVSPAISQNAPDTRLRLVLEGVAIARRSDGSSAIVAEGSGGKVQWYRVGEELPGDARLVEVQHDRILLRREGRIETLRFPVDRGNSAAAVASERREPQDLPQTTEEFVSEAQDRLSRDPGGTLAMVGFSPRDDTGRGGYVYDGSNPMLNTMSLRPGDVVLSINGQVLGDIDSDRELIQQWSEQQELQVEVERDGSRISVVVPVP